VIWSRASGCTRCSRLGEVGDPTANLKIQNGPVADLLDEVASLVQLLDLPGMSPLFPRAASAIIAASSTAILSPTTKHPVDGSVELH